MAAPKTMKTTAGGGAGRLFEQSEAVQRCRNATEAKLRAQFALVKLADEEVTVLASTHAHSRQTLRTHLFDLSAQDARSTSESVSHVEARGRKQQLSALVDRLAAMRKELRFQEEARERGSSMKGAVEGKRVALRTRVAMLEMRQGAERTELISAQRRTTETMARIRAIELASIKDAALARTRKRENAVALQQSQMRQQKEAEFLREIQLRKVRQLAVMNELEIQHALDLEDLHLQHKHEELLLLNAHSLAEAAASRVVEVQVGDVEVVQLAARQKGARAAAVRANRRAGEAATRAGRAEARAREKFVVAENPIIRGEQYGGAGDRGAAGDAESGFSDGQSMSRSQSSMGMSEGAGGADTDDGQSSSAGAGDGPNGWASGDNNPNNRNDGDDDAAGISRRESAAANAHTNRSSALPHDGESDEQRELRSVAEQGRERLRNVLSRHKHAVTELHALQRSQVHLKQKEQRRKVAAALKEYEEDVEILRQEQIQAISDLMAEQGSAFDRETQGSVDDLTGTLLPVHVVEDIAAGRTPGSAAFRDVTVVCIELADTAHLSSRLGPAGLLALLRAAAARIDAAVAADARLFRLEAGGDGGGGGGAWVVAAGINGSLAAASSTSSLTAAGTGGLRAPRGEEALRGSRVSGIDGSDEFAGDASGGSDDDGDDVDAGPSARRTNFGGVTTAAQPRGVDAGGNDGDAAASGAGEMARAAVACAERVLRLTFADALAGLEVDGGADGGDFDAEEVRLRVGVHTGDAIGGLIGSKAPRYSLHGDAVRTSIALCRNGVPGTANVSDAARRMACVA